MPGPTRQCGDCTLCCKLLPVRPLGKGAGERCKHQRRTGCQVYHQRGPKGMPLDCQLWNCRWLVNDDTAELSRPDRSFCVIDIMPDFVTMQDKETGKTMPLEVVQVWVDPKHPNAWRNPAMLDYLARRGEEGKAALIRYDARDAFVLMPPALAPDGQFHDMRDYAGSSSLGRDHSPEEIISTLLKR